MGLCEKAGVDTGLDDVAAIGEAVHDREPVARSGPRRKAEINPIGDYLNRPKT